MSESGSIVRFGIVGLGGWGGKIARDMLKAAGHGEADVKLIAACDPFEANREAMRPALESAGAVILNDFDALLEQPIDAVWMPLPIDLHRQYVEQAFAAEKQVVCEKPIAGSIDDARAMIEARNRAGRSGLIGFQHIYHPEFHTLKRELLEGKFGTLRSITIKALWPRDSHYYGRNTWAARVKRDGRWVMDSPANNALAHPIHLCMFLAGAQYLDLAAAKRVQAELYRANPIENYDTIAMRAELETGVRLHVLLTHATDYFEGPVIDVQADLGSVRILQDNQIQRMDSRGQVLSTRPLEPADMHMMRGVGRYMQGGRGDVAGTFEMAYEHLRLMNAVSQATAVQTVDSSAVQVVRHEDGASVHVIDGIKPLFDLCARRQLLPSETGEARWSRAGGTFSLSGYNHFAGPKLD